MALERDPLQFLGKPLGLLGVLLALDFESGALLLEVSRVVSLVRVEVPAVHFRDPFGDVVEEVTVVGDGEDSPGVAGKVLLEPQHAFGVKVVGGLVQQQKIGLLQQQLAEGDPAALTTGEQRNVRVGRRAAQSVHGLLQLGVEVPGVGGVDGLLQLAHLLEEDVIVSVRAGHFLGDLVEALDLAVDLANAFLDVAQDGLLLVQRRLLQQDTDGVAGAQPRLTVGGGVQPGHDLEDGGLTGSVRANDTNLGAGEKGHAHIVEDEFFANGLTGLAHCVDKFRHAYKSSGLKPISHICAPGTGVRAAGSPRR
ncbi:hypothetical protein QFZ61_002133 [Arthrobacter sp. B3I4]|nr:hypothetical protein [Arthrobacter sp. B3I4]